MERSEEEGHGATAACVSDGSIVRCSRSEQKPVRGPCQHACECPCLRACLRACQTGQTKKEKPAIELVNRSIDRSIDGPIRSRFGPTEFKRLSINIRLLHCLFFPSSNSIIIIYAYMIDRFGQDSVHQPNSAIQDANNWLFDSFMYIHRSSFHSIQYRSNSRRTSSSSNNRDKRSHSACRTAK